MTDDILSLLEGLYEAVEQGRVTVTPSEVANSTYTIQSHDKLLCLNFEKQVYRRVLDSSSETIHYQDVLYRLYQPPAIRYTIFLNQSHYEMATKLWELIELKNPPKSTKDILDIVNAINASNKKPIVEEKYPPIISAREAKDNIEKSYGTYAELLQNINDSIQSVSTCGGHSIYITQQFSPNYGKMTRYINQLRQDLEHLGYEIKGYSSLYHGMTFTISWK